MKKKLSLLALPLFLLVGCNSSAHQEFTPNNSGSYSPVSEKDLKFFALKDVDVSLKLNETYELKSLFNPVLNPLPKITYTSSNPSVVSVSESGVVTGKASGYAIINAKCGDFTGECVVSVTKENSKSEATTNINEIYKVQADSSFVKPDYLRVHERSNYTLYKNGEIMNESEGIEETVMSKENAYIYINDPYDARYGVVGGNPTYSAGIWLFYCTPEFETFIFHEVHGIKRYMKVDCAKYIESGDRWGAIGEVMGNIFSNYFDILERQYKVVADAATLKSDVIGSIKEGRADDHGGAYASTSDSYKNQKMDYDLQRIFGIPASGGLCDIAMTDEYYFSSNVCKYCNFAQVTSYSWRGDDYVYDQRGWRSYDIEPKELYYPDIKAEGWTEGEDIFDI